MMKTLLRLLAVCGLGAVVLAGIGCGSTKVTTGSSGMFAPQTGSILGRRLPAQQRHQTQERSTTRRKAEKQKTHKPAKQPKRERADEDYMTRGGFR